MHTLHRDTAGTRPTSRPTASQAGPRGSVTVSDGDRPGRTRAEPPGRQPDRQRPAGGVQCDPGTDMPRLTGTLRSRLRTNRRFRRPFRTATWASAGLGRRSIRLRVLMARRSWRHLHLSPVPCRTASCLRPGSQTAGSRGPIGLQGIDRPVDERRNAVHDLGRRSGQASLAGLPSRLCCPASSTG
jgi:hypothetical protein